MDAQISNRVRAPSPPPHTFSSPSISLPNKRRKMSTTRPEFKQHGQRKGREPKANGKMKGDEEDDPNRSYCICKETDDGVKPMIQCDGCKDWFHFGCVGLKETEAEMTHRYACPTCSQNVKTESVPTYTFDITLLPEPSALLASPTSSTSIVKMRNPKSSAKGNPVSKAQGKPRVRKDFRAEKKEGAGDDQSAQSGNEENASSGSSVGTGSVFEDADDGMASGSDAEIEHQSGSGAESASKAVRHDNGNNSGKRLSGLKRKKSTSNETSEGVPSPRKARRTSGVEEGPSDHSNPSKKDEKTPPLPIPLLHSTPMNTTEWTPLRAFCLSKLKTSLESVFKIYHEAHSQQSISLAQKAEETEGPIVGIAEETEEGNVALAQAMDVDRPDALTSTTTASDKSNRSVSVPVPSGSELTFSPSNHVMAGANVEMSATDSGDEVTIAAGRYATELEAVLFAKHQIMNKAKKRMEPSPSYRAQFNLINSSLEHDLRTDLQQGITTGQISPTALAGMNARDLATEETLKEINQIEAESLKSLVRMDDEAPVKYTKKILEDSEALQQIQSAINRSARGGGEAAETAERVQQAGSNVSRSQRAAPGPRATSDVTNRSDKDVNLQGPTGRSDASPASKHATPPPSADRRRSSFSLRAVLGDGGGAESSDRTPEHTGSGDDDEELPGFVTGHDDDGDAGSFDDDYFDEGEKRHGSKEEAVSTATATWNEEPKEEEDTSDQHQLELLPIVWKGEIENPADTITQAPTLEARQIGGPDLGIDPSAWRLLIPQNPIVLTGRVPTKDSIKYLMASNQSISKNLVLVAFTPASSEEAKQRFEALMKFHQDRDRHGVALPYGNRPPPPGAPRETYFVPLRASESYQFIDDMDRNILPRQLRTQDILLGVFIIPKGKSTLTAPPAASRPAWSAPVVPSQSEPPSRPLPPPATASSVLTPPIPHPVGLSPLPPIQAIAASATPPQLPAGGLSALLASLNPTILSQFAAPQANTTPPIIPGGSSAHLGAYAPPTSRPEHSNTGYHHQPNPIQGMPNFPPSFPPQVHQHLAPRPNFPPFAPTMVAPTPPHPSSQSPLSPPSGRARPQPPVHPSRLAAMSQGMDEERRETERGGGGSSYAGGGGGRYGERQGGRGRGRGRGAGGGGGGGGVGRGGRGGQRQYR